ncbi:hypothetical protein AAFC00_004286 [Neodothiora populina]|uniref:Uncharacterized protein n=1 Tax=Neodothiora populina TaxID=2781224 RepID=A0ABR3PJI6_9PEZI
MCDSPGPQAPHYDIQQEREFYKYLQPHELGLASVYKSDGVQNATRTSPIPSPDRALTAFAQLATLRLNCRRAFISFFDREYQYLVAEATRSLSLETQSTSQAGDQLMYGVAILTRNGSVCEHTVSLPVTTSRDKHDASVFIIPDCRKDDRFKDRHYTTHADFRFYAGVPIVSPDGLRIGSYCVVDDQPRHGLADDEVAFMKDMSTTIMVHMDMLRAKSETVKGERMVRGLGSFVEGKASIDDWWMGPETSASPSDEESPKAASQAHSWANKQYSTHHKAMPIPPAVREKLTQDPAMVFRFDTNEEKEDEEADDEVKPTTEDYRSKETEKQDTLAIEVKATFGRATRIVREALGIDGVCCFDAKAGHTFGGLIDQAKTERSKRRKLSHQSDEEVSSQSDPEESTLEPQPENQQQKDKPCEVLGFSTANYSSIHGDQANKVTDGMTETFLRSLLRRFPHGKIINFDENGHTPSETKSTLPDFQKQSGRKRSKKELRTGEAEFLLRVFPKARSLAIVPLWDSRQQFFSGCVAWTRSAYRVLTPHSELSYLAAFGDSIMAEVSRVDAKIADKSKSDFISSISHELRSPLHGILGSVECLQDSELDPFQENLVHTVETCAKTLLDNIDHLLDFAKINNFARKGGNRQQGKTQNIALDVDVDLSVVTEEVLETVFAGHDFMKLNNNSDNGPEAVTSSATSFAQRAQQRRKSSVLSNGPQKNVSVVVDIDKAEESHWIFRTQAGAWRRILMNLFGNALKYTEAGFVQVKLDAKPLPKEGKVAKSTVILTVIDSGKGISQDYLNSSLFVPFAQEDSFQPGTGLGLAITAAIIRSMGGTIDVKSEKGHGTEITVKLGMTHAPYSQESLQQSIISSAARRTQGLKIGFVGFDADSYKGQPATEERSPQNSRYNFMSSFHSLCQNWFGMDMKIMTGLDQADADIFLTTEVGLEQIQGELDKIMEKQSDKDAQISVKGTPLLVLCTSASTANYMLHNQRMGETADIAEYISQPCGPRKLAKSLVLCLDRLEALKKRANSMPTFNESILGPLAEEIEERRPKSEGAQDKTSEQSLPLRDAGKSTKPSRPSVKTLKDAKDDGDTEHDRISPKSAKSPSSLRKLGGSLRGEAKPATPERVRNVLLVDDNKINLQLLVTYIKKTGHNYTTAGDGRQAFEAYKKQCVDVSPTSASPQKSSPFDYILMDVSMPIMDGLESTRLIRAYERDNNIRPTTVVALTGLASASAQQEAYSSGVNTFMTKPVKLKELGRLLDKEEDDDGNVGVESPVDEKKPASDSKKQTQQDSAKAQEVKNKTESETVQQKAGQSGEIKASSGGSSNADSKVNTKVAEKEKRNASPTITQRKTSDPDHDKKKDHSKSAKKKPSHH